jgi:hypothetical protein
MVAVKTQFNYRDMPGDLKDKIVKEALKNANKDQNNLVKKYEKAVAEKRISPIN